MSTEALKIKDASPGYAASGKQGSVPPGYRATDAQVIPIDWRLVPLHNIGKLQSGNGFPIVFQGEQEGIYPFFKVSDMNNEGNELFMKIANHWISEETKKRLGAAVFPGGSIVFAKIGAAIFLERKRILSQDSCLDNNMMGFVFYDQNVCKRFFHYVFLRIDLGKLVSTTALPALSGREVGAVRIPLPSIPEQRAIAEALSDVDSLLSALDALIAKKRAIKQATMQQLLTGKTSLPGFCGNWETKQLGELGRFLKGSGVKRDDAQSGQLACVRYGEIYTTHDDYIREFHSRISVDVAATATRLEKGDLLFAGSGETKEEIGKCVAFLGEEVAYAGGDIVILRPQNVDSLFLGYALNIPQVNRQKASRGQGDAVVHISANALSQIALQMPGMEEQSAIATVLSDMDAEISALEVRRAKTHAIKRGMMQQLLTGRVRLVVPKSELQT